MAFILLALASGSILMFAWFLATECLLPFLSIFRVPTNRLWIRSVAIALVWTVCLSIALLYLEEPISKQTQFDFLSDTIHSDVALVTLDSTLKRIGADIDGPLSRFNYLDTLLSQKYDWKADLSVQQRSAVLKDVVARVSGAHVSADEPDAILRELASQHLKHIVSSVTPDADTDTGPGQKTNGRGHASSEDRSPWLLIYQVLVLISLLWGGFVLIANFFALFVGFSILIPRRPSMEEPETPGELQASAENYRGADQERQDANRLDEDAEPPLASSVRRSPHLTRRVTLSERPLERCPKDA